ncbi:acidic endochitinase WIN6.2C-like [Manihot esculenta]|uniref:Chitin-binding type-1 domain-containing protein n=1 Tax=Manihot esculenta TaxID=3983 RepID=A0A2C9U4A8_MANES|nr:acidic endochitinase WIN6.2C [Manihot esculenta]XP_043809106.1 acidic endochitinase WIN6.2C-like [Manihot esculenta]OAY24232.1 hypothetical protein MANES_18G146901v8 [Manihot esculenta]
MRVFAFIVSSLLFTSLWLPTSAERCGIQVDERCGIQADGVLCCGYRCCSKWGWCGTTKDYCCDGCQSRCDPTKCDHTIRLSGRRAGILRGGGGNMSEISSEKAFDKMLSQKPHGLYT